MKTTLQLRANATVVTKYRQLLCDEWNRSALTATIDLVNSQLPKNASAMELAFDGTLFDPWPNGNPDPVVSERFRDLVQANFQSYLPALPVTVKARAAGSHKRLWENAICASAALIAPSRHRLDGNVDLFFDSLSLLFLISIHALLPDLASEHLNKERSLLLNALWVHCQTAWSNEIAHQQYLLACLYRSMKEDRLEEAALKNAFHLTDASDHDFVSKAQAVWICLLEHNRLSEARAFLLQAARRAPEAALVELSEMVGDTLPKAESA